MKVIRQKAKLASILLTILILYITVPFDSVVAAMINTETTLDLSNAQQSRDDISNLLLREDVQNALLVQGIEPVEAKARIDSLSDAEVVRIADQIDKMPVGSSSSLVVLLVVLAPYLLVIAISIPLGFLIHYLIHSENSDSPDSEDTGNLK